MDMNEALPAPPAGTEVQAPAFVPLSVEECNDLRKRVLRGEELSVEEARRVIETLRQGQGTVLAKEAKTGTRKPRASKKGMSDEELGSSLDAALGLLK